MRMFAEDRGLNDYSVGWLGWAPTKKILRLRKWLYLLVSGECAPAGPQDADDVVLKRSVWKHDVGRRSWKTNGGQERGKNSKLTTLLLGKVFSI